jgi:hypothetical protein
VSIIILLLYFCNTSKISRSPDRRLGNDPADPLNLFEPFEAFEAFEPLIEAIEAIEGH